jgi:hypothetical protein
MEIALHYLNAINLHLHILPSGLLRNYTPRMQALRIRTGLNGLILLLGGVMAHYLADGTFIKPFQFLASGVSCLLLIATLESKKLEGPRLALLVLLTQSFGHLILGGNTPSNITMAVSHLFAGLFTYWLISHAEVFWSKTSEILSALFLPNCLDRFTLQHSANNSTENVEWIFNPFLGFRSMWMRGPPLSFGKQALILKSKGNL